MFLKNYSFGNNTIWYAETPLEGHEGVTVTGFAIYPKTHHPDIRSLRLDSMIQAAFTGDDSLIDYTRGVTMLNRAGCLVKVEEQTADERGVVTRLSDGAGNRYVHTLQYNGKTGVFTVWVEYENGTGRQRTLEHLSSFCLSGLYALSRRDTCGLTLHRMTSAWSRECRLKSDGFSAIGMDMSWGRYGVKCERWGEVGSMANRGYYPFAAVEDGESGTVWTVTMEAPYSWQTELYQEKESCTLSGGLGDYEAAHWRKHIPAGGKFCSHKAFFTVQSGLNGACNALLKEADSRLQVPQSEEEMPVLFNEYCTTWGCPSEENVQNILKAIRPFGIDTFVIDCGWYKPEDKGWCNAIGDWEQSKALFPAGIKRVADAIQAEGMNAGIWFEFENAGRDSKLFGQKDYFLTRDGAVITAKNRRFLDLRKQNVKDYLQQKMISFLRENGFRYLKIDYNDAYGLGCDGAESLGEGGRQVAEESLFWLQELKEKIPDIVLENCASGGSRIEPLRMNKVAMCSFSDAHECAEIPLVAANVSRAVPARQMQIWAVIRKTDSLSRIVYSLSAAMMGRICLSGDVLELSARQIDCIKEGLDFYRSVRDVVRYGDIVQIDNTVQYYRNPEGRQIYIKSYGDRRLLLLHNLEGEREIRLSLDGYCIDRTYTDCAYREEASALIVAAKPFTAGAFLLKKGN